jgi:nitric oxide reductase NorD protein
VPNPNLPPPSKPQDEDGVRSDRRIGIPYPEWNLWTKSFLPNHVAVVERRHGAENSNVGSAPGPEITRWFHQRTQRAFRAGLESGTDLDVDGYVSHFIDSATGHADEPKVFRELARSYRDVATALLLDGSSSLSVHGGREFELELICADALSSAMTLTRERHAVFVFNGNTRHRVEVRCLKDFDDSALARPTTAGLHAGGYTRLGAPIRHLTRRLLDQRAERRLLIIMGDGLISDEGYEGRYAWADVAHALQEANEACVSVYYIGVGSARVDPLPEVFGIRRSRRIRRVEELPRALSEVHRELVAA